MECRSKTFYWSIINLLIKIATCETEKNCNERSSFVCSVLCSLQLELLFRFASPTITNNENDIILSIYFLPVLRHQTKGRENGSTNNETWLAINLYNHRTHTEIQFSSQRSRLRSVYDENGANRKASVLAKGGETGSPAYIVLKTSRKLKLDQTVGCFRTSICYLV